MQLRIYAQRVQSLHREELRVGSSQIAKYAKQSLPPKKMNSTEKAAKSYTMCYANNS